MNQAQVQYKFRHKNKVFQRELIQKAHALRMSPELEVGRRVVEMELLLKPRHLDILASLGVAFLAHQKVSGLQEFTVMASPWNIRVDGYRVRLKGFWREFKLFFREADRLGQLPHQEVVVFDPDCGMFCQVFWEFLTPGPKENDGDHPSQDNIQEAQADQGGAGSGSGLSADAGQVGQRPEVRAVELDQDRQDFQVSGPGLDIDLR